MEGWIKLFRRLLIWQWISSPNHLVVFIHLLLRANFRVTTWRGEAIAPGQLLTGRIQLAEWTGLSEMQVRKVLKDLKKSGEIELKTTKLYSIITVTNWDLYQGDIQVVSNEQPTNNQQTTNEQPLPKNAKKERRKEGKNIINKQSPLSFLFAQDDKIQGWLLTGNTEIQERLLNEHSHHILVEEITKAYMWQLARNKRKADMFLANWMGNKKTAAFNPNSGQVKFSGSCPASDISPQEIERAKELGIL